MSSFAPVSIVRPWLQPLVHIIRPWSPCLVPLLMLTGQCLQPFSHRPLQQLSHHLDPPPPIAYYLESLLLDLTPIAEQHRLAVSLFLDCLDLDQYPAPAFLDPFVAHLINRLQLEH